MSSKNIYFIINSLCLDNEISIRYKGAGKTYKVLFDNLLKSVDINK